MPLIRFIATVPAPVAGIIKTEDYFVGFLEIYATASSLKSAGAEELALSFFGPKITKLTNANCIP